MNRYVQGEKSMKKITSLLCVLLLIVGLVGLSGCAKKAQVTDYQAYLASTAAMNTPESRAIPVFQVSGITNMSGENISIVQREIINPVIPQPKKTGWDVLSQAIEPAAKLGGLFLGYKTITDVADTIADASETVVVQSQVASDPIIVEPTIVEPTIIQADPVFVEPWIPPTP